MNLNITAFEAFARSILMVVIFAVVSFLANAANLTGIVNPVIAGLIAGIFGIVENYVKQSAGGTGLFGLAKS